MRGLLSEALRHVDRALERAAPDPSPDRCRATHGAGLLAAIQGNMRAAQRRMEEAVALYRAVGDHAGSIRPLCDRASTMTLIGNIGLGEQLGTEALHIARGESDQWALGYALHTMGQLRLSQQRYAESATFS